MKLQIAEKEIPYQSAFEYYKSITDNGRIPGLLMESRTRNLAYGKQSIVAANLALKVSGKNEDVAGFCKAVKLAEIKKQEGILTPGRYVGAEEEEEDSEVFEEKMKRLTSELAKQMQEGKKLDEEEFGEDWVRIMTMKKRKACIYNDQLTIYLSPQYDLFGGNAGHPIFHADSGGFR